ncbi:MAG: hypothetical protein HRT35_07600 [Algicola sp.]|nr:hypothetical protein [Algicola sp.]
MNRPVFHPVHQIISIVILLFFTPSLLAKPLGSYDVSVKIPFGSKHPDAPIQVQDWQPMIGKSSCINTGRNPDGQWQKPVKMDWVFKYILNGSAVQDEILKEDGSGAGSIRQFDDKSGQWFVHYYSTLKADAPLRYWQGKRSKDKIVLTRVQKSFSGKEGSIRLTFFDFKPNSFEWLMEWVSLDKATVYAVRKISCVKDGVM